MDGVKAKSLVMMMMLCKLLQAKKITRINLIRRLRQIAGDKLLLATIKSYGRKVGILLWNSYIILCKC